MLSQKFINDMNKVIAEGNSDLSFGDGVDWFDEEVDTSSFIQASLLNYEEEQEQVERQPNKKIRKSRQPRGYWDEEANAWKRWDPKKSNWWYNYVVQMPRSKKQIKKFRRRFGISHKKWLSVMRWIREGNWFPKEEKPDAIGFPGSPIELLVLGSLRYMRRGWTFDDLEEATFISEEKHRKFFHEFVKVMAENLFPMFVRPPQTEEEINSSRAEYNTAGMHGCIGSADATHVSILQMQAGLKQYHMGAKLHTPARAFNIVVNHRRRILSTTSGMPARWNDKTIVLFDQFMSDLHRGKLYRDNEFQLYDSEGNEQTLKGLWLAVDNGYLRWPCTMPPFKDSADLFIQLRWSKWIESMRKDVECCFAILKGRWRILKVGFSLYGNKNGLDTVDNTWKTCCALHNMLLEEDGLDTQWSGSWGEHDSVDAKRTVQLINGRMANAGRTYDTSGLGCGHNTTWNYAEEVEDETDVEKESEFIRNLGFDNFRNKLVTHFHYLWRNQRVLWPSRFGSVRINEESF